MNKLSPSERLDNLGDNYFIIQNTNYFLFGIDAVLLSDFASKFIKRRSRVAEIGTGSGIIPLLVNKRAEFKSFDGFEIQEELADLARRNLRLNHLGEHIKVYTRDVRNYRDLPQNTYDVIITNPPYFSGKKPGKSKRDTITDNEKVKLARNEVTLDLDSIFKFSSWTLKQGGKLVMIYRSERAAELIAKADLYRFQAKVMRFVYSRIDKESILVLVEFTKMGKPGLTVRPPLIIYEEDNYTEEIDRIYEGISTKTDKKSGQDVCPLI